MLDSFHADRSFLQLLLPVLCPIGSATVFGTLLSLLGSISCIDSSVEQMIVRSERFAMRRTCSSSSVEAGGVSPGAWPLTAAACTRLQEPASKLDVDGG